MTERQFILLFTKRYSFLERLLIRMVVEMDPGRDIKRRLLIRIAHEGGRWGGWRGDFPEAALSWDFFPQTAIGGSNHRYFFLQVKPFWLRF